MSTTQDTISIPVAYIEAIIMMLGAFLIGYIGCYIYYNSKLKKQRLQALEKNQSLKKRVDQLKEELEQQERSLSYQKDRMDQDYEQVKFNVKAFSDKIIDSPIDEHNAPKINFDSIGYASEADKDNLQEISGIGPYTEEKLNKLGIYTFEQISKFTESEIQSVTDLIRFFPDRIKNDKWVSKARKLIFEQSGQKPPEKDIDEASKYAKTTS